MESDIKKFERMQVAERIKVMQAFVDGKDIQWFDEEANQWVDSMYPAFEPNTQYRVSPVVKRMMALSRTKPMRLFDPEVIGSTDGYKMVEVTFTIPEDYDPV